MHILCVNLLNTHVKQTHHPKRQHNCTSCAPVQRITSSIKTTTKQTNLMHLYIWIYVQRCAISRSKYDTSVFFLCIPDPLQGSKRSIETYYDTHSSRARTIICNGPYTVYAGHEMLMWVTAGVCLCALNV